LHEPCSPLHHKETRDERLEELEACVLGVGLKTPPRKKMSFWYEMLHSASDLGSNKNLFKLFSEFIVIKHALVRIYTVYKLAAILK
jgi:hypothetical protein